jgi:predicted phage baseplate assembly protein
VPGTRVRRARAWAGVDPAHPGLLAPGTVTVVVVPAFPPDRPQPSDELLAELDRYLRRRKTVGTRLLVAGPDYVDVTVRVRVRAAPAVEPTSLGASVRAALERFLHPLYGGPEGRGWPFGRDVYRNELLALVDGVGGVDYVLDLVLTAGDQELRCDNACLGPTQLVASGDHVVEVQT